MACPTLGRAQIRLFAGALSPGQVRRLQVLLIEDDVLIAEMYRAQLEFDGYDVTIAMTGRAGLGMLSSSSPDIVLLDILLPDLNGFEVLTEVSRLGQVVPVVILSNYGEPSMVDRGASLGAIDYLVKSRVDPALVSRSIPAWIEKSGEARGKD